MWPIKAGHDDGGIAADLLTCTDLPSEAGLLLQECVWYSRSDSFPSCTGFLPAELQTVPLNTIRSEVSLLFTSHVLCLHTANIKTMLHTAVFDFTTTLCFSALPRLQSAYFSTMQSLPLRGPLYAETTTQTSEEDPTATDLPSSTASQGSHTYSEPRLDEMSFSNGTSTNMVLIKVGSQQECFNVHKDILCGRSGYFRNAFWGGFREMDEGCTSLPSTSPTVFKLFLDWLYWNKLPQPTRSEDVKDFDSASESILFFEDDETAAGDEMEDAALTEFATEQLVELYLFADLYQIKQLRVRSLRVLMDNLASTEGMLLRYYLVRRAYENLPENSPMLDWLAYLQAKNYTSEADASAEERRHRATVPADFFIRVMVKMALRNEGKDWTFESCDACEHGCEKERRTCEERPSDKENVEPPGDIHSKA